jgi:hypothetical protein
METERPKFRFSYYPGTPTIEGAQKLKARAGAETSGVRFSVATQNTYTISGSVIDNTDSPAPKRYNVTASHMSDGGTGTSLNQNNADSNYAIRGVTPGDYWVTARSSTAMELRQLFGSAMVRVGENDVRVNLQIGAGAEVDGKIIIENSKGQSTSGIRLSLQAQTLDGGIGFPITNAGADQNGAFKFQNMQSGSYFFTIPGTSNMYLKQAVCHGRDFTYQALLVDSGVTVGDCTLTLATDTGVMKGQVLDSDKPVPNFVVVAIPQSISMRRVARYTVTAETDANGAFQISGMVPGDYLVFALPKDDEQSYFRFDFAERNQQDAERVSVKAGDAKSVKLKPGMAQE